MKQESYEYTGGKDNLSFAVQLTGSNYTSFVVTMWAPNVAGLSDAEIEALSHNSISSQFSQNSVIEEEKRVDHAPILTYN